MADKRLRNLNEASSITSGDWIVIDNDSYGQAKKFDATLLVAASSTANLIKGWAASIDAFMSSVTRTDYSDGLNAGWIYVSGTVTWPDGQTGHVDGVEYPDQPGI